MLNVIFALLLASSAERGEEIKLWPNGAPGSEGISAAEVSKPGAQFQSSAKIPSVFESC